jgi:hypothetical protein
MPESEPLDVVGLVDSIFECLPNKVDAGSDQLFGPLVRAEINLFLYTVSRRKDSLL